MIIFYFCKISFPTKLENMNNLPIELKMLMADILTCRQLVRLSLTSMNWYHITKVISLRRANAHLSCLHIKKFNPDNMNINSSVLVIGARRAGKTTLIDHLVDHHRTSLTGGIYYADEYTTNIYDTLSHNSAFVWHELYNNDAYDVMQPIFANDRHINIFSLLSTQYAGHITPTIRRLFRYIVIFRQRGHPEDLYNKLYLNRVFPSEDILNIHLQRCVRNYGCLREHTNIYGCLVIDTKDRNVFWYEADIHI